MILKGKSAVIYGATGSLGEAVSKVFAEEGADLFLVAQKPGPLADLARRIAPSSGIVDVAHFDARDPDAVEGHLNRVVKDRGSIDISFNLISNPYEIDGKPMFDQRQENFVRPIYNALEAHFVTDTAAARRMMAAKRGVILALSAAAGQKPPSNMGGWPECNSTVESFCRHLATEVGPSGVRVVCIRTAGSPDAHGMPAIHAYLAEKAGLSVEEFKQRMFDRTLLKRMPMCPEIGRVAAMLASDYASPITGAMINATCGWVLD